MGHVSWHKYKEIEPSFCSTRFRPRLENVSSRGMDINVSIMALLCAHLYTFSEKYQINMPVRGICYFLLQYICIIGLFEYFVNALLIL